MRSAKVQLPIRIKKSNVRMKRLDYEIFALLTRANAKAVRTFNTNGRC